MKEQVRKCKFFNVNAQWKKLISLTLVLAMCVSCITPLSGVFASDTPTVTTPDTVYLSDMEWESTNGNFLWGPYRNQDDAGNSPVTVNGQQYDKVLAMHAVNDSTLNGDIVYDIEGLGYKWFSVLVGKLNADPNMRVRYTILVDDEVKVEYETPGGRPAKKLEVPIEGAKKLTLRINCCDDGYGCDAIAWLNPMLSKTIPDEVYLSDMGWEQTSNLLWGPFAGRDENWNSPVTVNGTAYNNILTMHAVGDVNLNGDIVYNIKDLGYNRFSAKIGKINADPNCRAIFSVLVDGKEKYTCEMVGGQPVQLVDVPIVGASTLTLRINCGSDGHPCDAMAWIEPMLKKAIPDEVYLSDIGWKSTNGNFLWGPYRNQDDAGNSPVTVNGEQFDKVLAMHAVNDPNLNGDIVYDIEGLGYKWFSVLVGKLNADPNMRVRFSILVDDEVKVEYETPGARAAKKLEVPIEGAKKLTLRINCCDDGHGWDASAWLNPMLSKTIPDEVYLSDMGWEQAGNYLWGPFMGRDENWNSPLVVTGEEYTNGLAMHAVNDPTLNGDVVYDIEDLGYKWFSVLVGKLNADPNMRVRYTILVDDEVKVEYETPGGRPAKKLEVPIEGAKTLTLRINCCDDGYGCDAIAWLNPMLSKTIPDEVYLSDMGWEQARNLLWGPFAGRDENWNSPLVVTGEEYTNGLAMHAVNDPTLNGDVVYDIEGLGYKWFSASVGKLNSDPNMRVRFSILVDDEVKVEYETPGGRPAKKLEVPIAGAKKLTLRINCCDDGYGCDAIAWLNPMLSKTIPDEVYLSDMGWNLEKTIPAGAGAIHLDRTNDDLEAVVNGKVYEHVLGTHAINDTQEEQDIVYDIKGLGYTCFKVSMGIHDQQVGGNARFTILVDGVEVKKRMVHGNSGDPEEVYVDITGAEELTLRVNCGADGYSFDACLWLNPILNREECPVPPTVDNMPEILSLTDLEWTYAEIGSPSEPSVAVNQTLRGNPIVIAGITYEKGLATHTFNYDYPADVIYSIAGMGYKILSVDVGLDDETGGSGSVIFQVLGDGKVLEETGIIGGSSDPRTLTVDVTGIKEITLRALNANGTYDWDWACWGEPTLYKDASLMPAYMYVNELYDSFKIYEDNMNISGKSSGLNEIKVYVDDVLKETLQNPEADWLLNVSGINVGKHTLVVEGVKEGNVEKTEKYAFERIEYTVEETVQLNTQTTTMTIARLNGMLSVTSLRDNESNVEWLSRTSEVPFPEKITVDGEDKEVEWTFTEKTDVTKNNVRTTTFHFECEEYGLSLESVWMSYPNSDAPIRHYINMDNNGDKDITVYSVPTLRLNLKSQTGEKVELMSVRKGGIGPDGVGVYFDNIQSGFYKDIYTTTGGMYCSEDDNGGFIPFAGIQGDNHGIYVGLEWSECTTMIEGGGLLENSQSFQVTNGLNPEFYTNIPTGETYLIPPAFIGCYVGSRDNGSNQMKDWYDEYLLTDSVADERGGALEFNASLVQWFPRLTWYATDQDYFNLVDQLSELNFDEIVLDIGWNNEGVFEPAQERWPDGMEKHSSYAHDNNLLLGVYFRAWKGGSSIPGSLSDIEGIGKSSWFVNDSDNAALDLGDKEAVEVLKNGIYKMITEGNLDLWRTDFCPIVGVSDRTNRHSNDTDVAYWSQRGFNEVVEYLKEELPGFGIELCSTGGTLWDFGNLQQVIRVPGTDWFSSVDGRKAFYDVSYAFPSKQISNFFSDLQYAAYECEDHDYRFRSALLGAPIYTVQLPGDMPEEEYSAFESATKIYKEWIQPLVKEADVYHVLPRPDGINWDGMEYFDSNTGKGALLVFKPTTNQNTKNVKLEGLDASKNYHIWTEDGTIAYSVVSGAELMNVGVTFNIEGNYKSEILYIQEVGKDDGAIAAPSAFVAKSDLNMSADANSSITVEWKEADLAENYTVVLYDGASEILRKNTTKTSMTFSGLQSGKTYTWSVTAHNTFGSTKMSGTPSILATGDAYSKAITDLTIEGSVAKGTYKANGVVHLNSLKVQCDDAVLSTNNSKTIVVPLDSSAGYKTMVTTFAISDIEEGEQVKITLKTDLDVKKTVLLNSNDVDRKVSLDVEGASNITITVENTSKDILKQTEILRAAYANGTNPYPSYFHVLSSTAMQNYTFSADVRHDLIGAVDSTPQYGVFAGYVDEDNYVGAYLDYRNNYFTTTARVNGESLGTVNIKLAEDFDYYTYHNVTVYREGAKFKIYLDGELIDVRIADIGDAKVGPAASDTHATYKNMLLNDTAFLNPTVASGTWNGLAPKVIIGSPVLFEKKITITEKEPEALAKDKTTEVDKDAELSDGSTEEEGVGITFSESTDYTLFDYYSSNGAEWKIQNEKLVSNPRGEQKAILNTITEMTDGMIQADISTARTGQSLSAGLYFLANNVGNGQDQITSLEIHVESPQESKDLTVYIHKFDQTYLGSVYNVKLNNFFENGDTKSPIRLQVIFQDGKFCVVANGKTVVAPMSVPVGDFSIGSVGLRSQYSEVAFDNVLAIKGDVEFPKEDIAEDKDSKVKVYSFDNEDEAKEFDFYHSSEGGFEIEAGKLVPTGEAGEFKAVLKGTDRLYQSASVDIYPGASGKINSGIYVGVSNADHPIDKINALGILVESDFEGWEDAKNRIDLVIGSFPEWKELSRTISETGNNNNLFKNGEKEPLNLKVDIIGNTVLVTLSLISNPEAYVQVIYEYVGDCNLEMDAIGLRSMFDDSSFDNLKVTYKENDLKQDEEKQEDEEKYIENDYSFDSVWDALDFDFYHSSKGGFTISNGKLTPAGDEGEFKAILRGNDRSYKTVSVDIYPGAKGTINSGLYIGAKGAGHAVDKINALGILIQSDFEGWEDAANRLDIIVGEFPDWKELSRTISETGENNALFKNGEKEPVNLRVDIDGNKLTITVSLLSDPTVYVQTVYEYTGKLDLGHGAVGIRSMFDDCSFDNFKVSYDKDASVNDSNKDSAGNKVDTGDGNGVNIMTAFVMMVLALGVILVTIRKRRKI